MSHSQNSDRMSWSVRTVVLLFLCTGVAALAVAILPTATLEWISQGLGHGEDISAERIARLRIAGMGLSAVHGVIALALATAWKRAAAAFLAQFGQELRCAGPVSALTRIGELARGPGWFHLASLTMLFVLATLIRLRFVQVPMDYDEAYSYLNYAQRPLYQGLVDYNSTNNHLLNTLGMHLAAVGFGPQEWALRLHVLLAGIGVVVTSYVLGRCLVDPQTGLLTAAMVAISYVAINYSVNARGYIWVAWMTQLLLLAFWRLGRDGGESLAVDWLAASFATIIGLYAVPTMLYSIAGGCAWLAWRFSRTQTGRRDLARLGVWLVLTSLVVVWLYAPAFVYQGFSAWRHPFVTPLPIQQWLGRVPVACYVALRSWAECRVPWYLSAGLSAVGLLYLWLVRRAAFGLVAVMFGVTVLVMSLQRVAPPPRILCFLAPLFALTVAAGAAGLGRVIFLPTTRNEVAKRDRQFRHVCSWLACGLVLWGYFDIRKQDLPGGAIPIFLVEEIPSLWAKLDRPVTVPPHSQLWRLDIKEAVAIVVDEKARIDRVLVGLPADLPFHFYTGRRVWRKPINGTPLPHERLMLVLPASERPRTGLRHNLSLQITDPAIIDRHWEYIAGADLILWHSMPPSPEPKP